MDVEVRQVEASEATEWLDHLGRAFFMPHGPGVAEDYFAHAEPGRSLAALDGGRVVGTLRSFGTELTVPGPGPLRASALTAVSVSATHRRRGVLRRMLTEDLAASKERGEAVSILLASEYPIYGRFGYGPATEQATYEVSATALRFLAAAEGTVELVDLPTLRRFAPGIFEGFRRAQPGSIARDDHWWDRFTRQVEVPDAKPYRGFQAAYRSQAGELEGYVVYEGALEWSPLPAKGTLTVAELVATTPAAYQALWAFCCEMDLVTTVTAVNRTPDEVLPLLVDDARKVRLVARSDFLWVRVLDVGAALAARAYLDDGSLVLEVHDELGLADGRVELRVEGGRASCRRSTAAPELSVPARALGAAYLGGTSWRRLAAAGLADEHVDGAIARADGMFTTPTSPWCTTGF